MCIRDSTDTVYTNSSDAKDQLLEMAVKDGMLMHHDAKDQLLEMAVKDGMLMHHDFHSKTSQEVDQVIVQESLRGKILHLAHDIPHPVILAWQNEKSFVATFLLA